MKYRRTLTILLFIVSVFTLTAQKVLPVRIEVPSAIDVETFNVEPLAKNGVLIFYESNEVNDEGLRKWYFGLFNTKLKQEWLKFVPLPDKIEYIKSVKTGNKMHLFFKNTTRTRVDNGFYEIISYNISSGEFSKISGIIPESAEVAGFEAIGNTACLALNLKKENTDLLFINLSNGDIKPHHIHEGIDSQFETLYSDSKNKKFYIAVKAIKDNRYITDEITRFSYLGNQEAVMTVQNPEAIKVTRSFVFTQPEKNKLALFGTYDIVSSRINSFKDFDDEDKAKGAGMFYLSFENGEQTSLKFHDFLSFENVYGTLGNRQMEYSKRKDVDNESGKTLTAYYHMCEPQVFKTNGQYIFSVEVYKPYYRSETRMDYDYYGRPVPYTYNIFDGYQFYDVVIVGLKENGDLIWNNDFVIRDLKSFNLTRNSIVFIDNDFISMAYVNNGKILAQTIEGPVDIGQSETEIETKLNRDRISDDESNYIVHWYGDFYLAYGYQKLNNRTLTDQNIRMVFYVNKSAFK